MFDKKDDNSNSTTDVFRPAKGSAKVVIGHGVTINGEIKKADEVQIDGEADVTMKTDNVVIGATGDCKGNIETHNADIWGKFDGEIKTIKTDFILGFFGLIMQLGPLLEWGLNIDKKLIPVNTENFETNKKGIFAIGDICFYPGKLKLILSGFHEGALAARGCFKYSRPNEKYKLEFTTTSKSVKNRLGIKE